MTGLWKDFHKELAEREIRMREVNKHMRAFDGLVHPNKKPPGAWEDLKFEFSLIFQKLLITLLAAVFAAIIYPIAIYIFFKLLF
jgi:hypothetical protein